MRKSYLCFSVSERLRCRISFISYWCYFVLSGLLSACKGIWEHLREDTCLFNMCVGMCRCEVTWCVCVWCSCFRQYLCSRPVTVPPPPNPHPHSLFVFATVQSKCVSLIYCSVGISLYFSICFLLQPLLCDIGACMAIS